MLCHLLLSSWLMSESAMVTKLWPSLSASRRLWLAMLGRSAARERTCIREAMSLSSSCFCSFRTTCSDTFNRWDSEVQLCPSTVSENTSSAVWEKRDKTQKLEGLYISYISFLHCCNCFWLFVMTVTACKIFIVFKNRLCTMPYCMRRCMKGLGLDLRDSLSSFIFR